MASRVASLMSSTVLVTPQGEALATWRSPRERDRRHLANIARLPCVICASWPVEVAHIRFAVPEIGKPYTGMQEKPSDCWTVPLCAGHHRQAKDSQHASNERRWWKETGIDVIALARDLHACRDDHEAMLHIINSRRPDELQHQIVLDPLVPL